MRGRLAVTIVFLAFTTSLFAKDVYLSVSGKANGFFSDARIFNPSFDNDITIQARYLPAGNADNSAVQPITLTIPKRSMKIYDDAVQSMFGGSPHLLGAIRLTSADGVDFVATQRIYQDARLTHQQGTLGQFVPGLEASAAKTKGVLLQLKSGPSALGTFRTNWGGANPNAVVANVTFKLYDNANAVVSTKTFTFQPFGVQGPGNIAPFFDNPNNIGDAWISFTSDQPVFLYGSVVDNGSVDPTFIPASDDTGVPPPPPPPPQTKVITVHATDGNFAVTVPQGLAVGDEVKFIMTGEGGSHGIRLFSPSGSVLFSEGPLGTTPIERTITITAPGSYQYICTNLTCSDSHSAMSGGFNVGPGNDDPGDRY